MLNKTIDSRSFREEAFNITPASISPFGCFGFFKEKILYA